MGESSTSHALEVWGDFACFTRPEMAVERYSYPCPTPSAARGIFESIYFKPAIYWQVTKIEILEYPSYIALRRNEVKDKISERAVKRWIAGKEDPTPLLADGVENEKGRTQRQTMAIRSPRYRVHARMVPRAGNSSEQKSSDSQFVRRASQGKCFQQPYLGCKEFVCFFRYVDDLRNEPAVCPYTQDLGYMLYDVFNLEVDNHAAYVKNWEKVTPSISMFHAKINAGVLEVPDVDSELVLKAGR